MSLAFSRNSAAYKNMEAFNVNASELRCVSFWLHRWSLSVSINPSMDRQTLKRIVEHYLEVEFEASEFAWYVSRSQPNRWAFVHFKSFAL